MQRLPDAPSRIEDYALIGDGRTAALVSRGGSLDWLCLPRFDSPACFAALLGKPEHGRWLVAATDTKARVRRSYWDGTMILETTFESDSGAAAVIDFMPVGCDTPTVIRIVEGRRGRVEMVVHLALRFDYGLSIPWVRRLEGGGLCATSGPNTVVLRTPLRLAGQEDLTSMASFAVQSGQTVPFVLTHSPSHLDPPEAIEPHAALAETEAFWRDWSDRCTYRGAWREPVLRSLLTLKALIHAPTGGIVAAPTTSLPEQLGGVRNWDYRYCWLRDATWTLLALMHAGYCEEAQAWGNWLHRSVAGSPAQLQIMYGIASERLLFESEVPWLPGYEGASPVRIGNAASAQVQLDVYGELMDAFHQARLSGLDVPTSTWSFQCKLIEHLGAIWDQPDQGIWEIRGPPRHFIFSKVMAWVALDRMVRDAERCGLPGPLDEWRRSRARIHETVCREGFDTERGSFVQSFGAKELDASLLLLPLVGFLPARDPRIQGTVAAAERELMANGLVLRYRTEAAGDGLPPGEGAFLACSFWLACDYALLGRRAESLALFERLLSLRNDVGLLAEEYDPRTGRQIGNFPQAFSHLALLGAAFALQDGGPAQRRSRSAGSDTRGVKE